MKRPQATKLNNLQEELEYGLYLLRNRAHYVIVDYRVMPPHKVIFNTLEDVREFCSKNGWFVTKEAASIPTKQHPKERTPMKLKIMKDYESVMEVDVTDLLRKEAERLAREAGVTGNFGVAVHADNGYPADFWNGRI